MDKHNTHAVPQALSQVLKKYQKVALGFSGGTDSAYLLYAAKVCGLQVQPFYVKTAFQPAFEHDDALRLCKALEIPLQVLPFDVLRVEMAVQNGPRRCYYCKQALFGRIKVESAAQGYSVVMDGNNASDDAVDRPGMQAAEELAVISPLRMAGVTKAQVRAYSKDAGLFTWEKPAYACLATRIAPGQRIEQQALARVEAAEACLHGKGFNNFRVRHHGGQARLEVEERQMPFMLQKRKEILYALRELGYESVVLDLTARQEEKHA